MRPPRRGEARRGALLAALIACGVLAAGACGSAGESVRTDYPEAAFAPLVWLHGDEPYRPIAARWFLARSALWLAEGRGCPDRKMAVGKRLAAQRDEVVDWLFVTGIGWGPTYWREVQDERCEPRDVHRYYTNQYTRPHGEGSDRAKGLHPGEGYYLDLMDWARPGPAAPARERVSVVPTWFERREAEVDGEPGVRLTYWMLYGMSEPRDSRGRPVARVAHEGDWERVEVLLRGGDGEYEPMAVRLFDDDGRARELAWASLRRTRDRPSGSATHPVLHAARASHALYARPGRHRSDAGGPSADDGVVDVAPPTCDRCRRWETWRSLSAVRERAWYGFGGAWGEVGASSSTTGPLGPHGEWAAGNPADDLRRSRRRPR